MKLLTDEQIDRIYRSVLDRSGESVSELDYVKALLEAQAILTQGETLKGMGEWLRRNGKMIIDSTYILCPADIDKFQRGEIPEKEG